MFVGSPLAQAWTRVEEEDDEFPKPAAVRPSMTQHPSIHAGLSQTQSAHSLPEVDDEGLPFSMD